MNFNIATTFTQSLSKTNQILMIHQFKFSCYQLLQNLLTIILFGVLPAFSIHAQVKSTDSTSKSIKEKAILKNYSNIPVADKVKANEQILDLWFDSNKYSRITLSNNLDIDDTFSGVYRSAGLLYSKVNNKVLERVAFFDVETGKIAKLLDVNKINPYSKAKLPLLIEDLKYDGELFKRVPKLNGNPDKSLIKNYFAWTAGGWQGNFFVLVFRKYGITDNYGIVDEWNKHQIYDNSGNLIFDSGEVNYHAFLTRLREDGKYYIVEINDGDFNVDNEGNTWQTQGFIVFDVAKEKEVYKYFLPKNDLNKYFNGVTFDTPPSQLIVAFNSFKNDKSKCHEMQLIDIVERKLHVYTFSEDECNYYSANWNKGKTFKNFKNLLPHFSFNTIRRNWNFNFYFFFRFLFQRKFFI